MDVYFYHEYGAKWFLGYKLVLFLFPIVIILFVSFITVLEIKKNFNKIEQVEKYIKNKANDNQIKLFNVAWDLYLKGEIDKHQLLKRCSYIANKK